MADQRDVIAVEVATTVAMTQELSSMGTGSVGAAGDAREE
jgi:hypothetical protein